MQRGTSNTWYWCWIADEEGKGITYGEFREPKFVAVNFAHVSQIIDQTAMGDTDDLTLLVFSNGERMLVKTEMLRIEKTLGIQNLSPVE